MHVLGLIPLPAFGIQAGQPPSLTGNHFAFEFNKLFFNQSLNSLYLRPL
jgi:hypothetical protein